MKEYRYGQTTVVVHDELVVTTLPDGVQVVAAPNHDDESIARAHALGYEGDVVAMTRDHDRFHALLAHALGLDESPALRAAATGEQSVIAGVDEDMVLAAQRLVNLARQR